MNPQQIAFPSKKQIEWWVKHLKSADPMLNLNLPRVDEKWFDDICSIIARLQFSFSPQELHTVAAHLFYNIDKRHDVIDGNKRSAIVIIYLFYLVNGYLLLEKANVKNLAKKVAKSRGHRQRAVWIEKIKNQLSPRVVKIGEITTRAE